MNCRDCGDYMDDTEIIEYLRSGLEIQLCGAKEEGICSDCLTDRQVVDGEDAEDIMTEFCG